MTNKVYDIHDVWISFYDISSIFRKKKKIIKY